MDKTSSSAKNKCGYGVSVRNRPVHFMEQIRKIAVSSAHFPFRNFLLTITSTVLLVCQLSFSQNCISMDVSLSVPAQLPFTWSLNTKEQVLAHINHSDRRCLLWNCIWSTQGTTIHDLYESMYVIYCFVSSITRFNYTHWYFFPSSHVHFVERWALVPSSYPCTIDR